MRSLVNPRALFGGHHDVTRRLNELKIPVQLIWGADDPLFPLAHAERAQTLIERLSLQERHGNEQDAAFFAHMENGDDVVALEFRGAHGLTPEPLARLRIGGYLGPHHFERYPPVQREV